MTYILENGEQVQVQLDPNNESFRYRISKHIGVIDKGPGGKITSGKVSYVFTDVNENLFWIENDDVILDAPYAQIEVHTLKSTIFINIPLPGHSLYNKDFVKLDGYPQPPMTGVPECNCGSDDKHKTKKENEHWIMKLFGQSDTTHYHWCVKRKYFETKGYW